MSLRIVGGLFRGRVLKTPNTDTTRPTTSMLREAVFNICAGYIDNARFLDLFAGSGAMGIEAISRGAAFSTLIELDPKALECIQANVKLLDISSQVKVIKADVLKALPKLAGPFDIIYVDPPYEKQTEAVLDLVHAHNLLAPEGRLYLEQRYDAKADFNQCSFEHMGSRRYGIAHLHTFRHKPV